MTEISQMQKFFQTAQGYVHLKTKYVVHFSGDEAP